MKSEKKKKKEQNDEYSIATDGIMALFSFSRWEKIYREFMTHEKESHGDVICRSCNV